MLKKIVVVVFFIFLSVLLLGITGGIITRVEDPGCYLYECDCFLYSEFSYSKDLVINTRFIPYAVYCCISTEARHYDANNNPLSVSTSASGECRYSIDGSPWYWKYVDVACGGVGVASCEKCSIMFYLFQVQDNFEAEAMSGSCFCSDL